MNTEVVMAALSIMGKGMLGIFVASLIIMLCVMVMGKLGQAGGCGLTPSRLHVTSAGSPVL